MLSLKFTFAMRSVETFVSCFIWNKNTWHMFNKDLPCAFFNYLPIKILVHIFQNSNLNHFWEDSIIFWQFLCLWRSPLPNLHVNVKISLIFFWTSLWIMLSVKLNGFYYLTLWRNHATLFIIFLHLFYNSKSYKKWSTYYSILE